MEPLFLVVKATFFLLKLLACFLFFFLLFLVVPLHEVALVGAGGFWRLFLDGCLREEKSYQL
jgi:hypothetical protein